MKLPTLSFGRTALAAALAATLVAASTSQARTPGMPAQTKQTAERNVVRVAPHSWNHRRIAALVDERTGLLRNNVRAICRGRGPRYSGKRYARFVCLLRPWPAAGRQELLVTYRARAHGRFRMHWLRLRRHK
jgi:hypothetical protein